MVNNSNIKNKNIPSCVIAPILFQNESNDNEEVEEDISRR
jgi:hypothetical protein